MKEEIKIIDGTYKKDDPHKDIGKQKFRVKKFYNVEVDYEVVANSKEEAEDAVQEHGGIDKIEFQDGYYGDEPVEVTYNDNNWDQEAEIDYEKYGREPRVQKIEECVPYEEQDIDTNEWIDNYEDPEWTKDSYRWVKNGDEGEQSSNTNKVETKDEIPF